MKDKLGFSLYLKLYKRDQLGERTHTLVFRQRQDIDRERKSDRGFSWEDGGASNGIIELRTAGPYTHTGGCWGLAGICPVILSGVAFARFGWICSDCKSSIFSHNKIYIWLLHRISHLGFFSGVSIPKIIVSILWCDVVIYFSVLYFAACCKRYSCVVMSWYFAYIV